MARLLAELVDLWPTRASRSWRRILAMPSATPHRSSRTGSKSPVPTSASIAGSSGAGLTTRSSWSAARRISAASTTFSGRRSRRRDGSTTSRPSPSGGSSRKAPSRRGSCASSTRRASREPTSSSASPRRRQPRTGTLEWARLRPADVRVVPKRPRPFDERGGVVFFGGFLAGPGGPNEDAAVTFVEDVMPCSGTTCRS